MPALTMEQIHAAMHHYVSNPFYCQACREGAARIDLLGQEVGVVTAKEAACSAARLAGIKAWKKKKTAAKKEAAAKKAAADARAKAEARAAARAAEIAAARPVPKGPNAERPTLHLKGMK
jgi:sRNA-binding protein